MFIICYYICNVYKNVLSYLAYTNSTSSGLSYNNLKTILMMYISSDNSNGE